jgi:uncharacterized BrkB/YihY/UPF0761 family membrane protein
MSRKTFSILSNIIFVLALVLGVYVLVSTYLARRALPPGVCPIDNNRTLIYISISLAAVSFIISIFEKPNKSKGNKSETKNETSQVRQENKEDGQ